jgi:hypothetical protein
MPTPEADRPTSGITAIAAVFAMILAAPSAAAPVLRCHFHTAGDDIALDVPPTDDPYRAPASPIGRHFRFKAVLTVRDGRVYHATLYTYYPDRGRTILLHAARHAAPAVTDGLDRSALTGEQRVYSPILERELVYGCALLEAAP